MKSYALSLPNDLLLSELVIGSSVVTKTKLKKMGITPGMLLALCFIHRKYSINRRVSCASVYESGLMSEETLLKAVTSLRKMGYVESDNQYFVWLTVEGEALLADYFREVRKECKRLNEGKR